MCSLKPPRHISTLPRLCENSDVELARRNFVSITLNRKRIALAVTVEGGKGENNSAHSLLAHLFTQVRRETGKGQVVQVHYDEGIADHIGPEPCAGIREDVGEASAGERAGRPLSRDRKLIPGADAVCVAEGNMSKSANASAWATRRGRRTWHARKLFVREPGDLRIGHRPLGVDGPRREGEEP